MPVIGTFLQCDLTAKMANPTFHLLSDEEISELISGIDSKNTKKTSKFAISKFESFAALTGTTLNSLSIPELDLFLVQFYANLRKDDGEDYSKRTLQVIRHGIQKRYMEEEQIDITDKRKFPKSNRVFTAVTVKLKREGKGAVKHKPVISSPDLQRIFASNELDCRVTCHLVYNHLVHYPFGPLSFSLNPVRPLLFRLRAIWSMYQYVHICQFV